MKALSPTDSAFLWMETRNQPMHVAGLNLYTPPPDAGPDFISNMLAEWRQHLKALTPFILRPVLRMGLWYWQEDTEFELDYHLRHVALPQPGRIRELLAMVSRVHGNLLDRNRPLWEAYVIEGLPGGRFATYIKMHHALVDGVSSARMMASALATSAQEQKPPLWAQDYGRAPRAKPLKAAPGVMEQFGHVVDAGKQILPGIASGLWDVVRPATAQDAAALPFQAPPTPFNVEISGSRRFASQTYPIARLKAIGTAASATINDVTLAICAGALREYLLAHHKLPAKPLVAMVPVSLHGETDAGGNQVSLLLANLATHLADPRKRLQRIVASTAEAKNKLTKMPRLQKMAHGMATISPLGPAMVTGTAKQYPPFNLVISNVPGPRESLYLNGAHLDEVYPVSIPTHYLALNITISGYRDSLGFGYIACRRSVPALQRMLDYTDNAIRALEDAFGLSSSGKTVPKSTSAKRSTAPKALVKRVTAQKRVVKKVMPPADESDKT